MTATQAVILDIGNVLIGWGPEDYYDRAIGAERRRALFAEVDLDAMNIEVDLGGDLRALAYGLADRHPGWAAEIRMWHDNWIDLLGPVIDGSVAAFRALRARGIPVFALSNFGTATFERAKKAYPFLAEFDRAYISGHMGVVKPDPEIYARVEADCGLAPGSLLFADDRPANVAAAAARGWQTHLFESVDGWVARLEEECLLSPGQVAA